MILGVIYFLSELKCCGNKKSAASHYCCPLLYPCMISFLLCIHFEFSLSICTDDTMKSQSVIFQLVFCPFFLIYVKDTDSTAVEREFQHIILGTYSINVEGGDATTSPADVGIVIEGVEVLHDLRDIASASALLMGVIYALNLSYPQELKAFFEVLQKVFLQLDASRLSSKVQMLKNKLSE